MKQASNAHHATPDDDCITRQKRSFSPSRRMIGHIAIVGAGIAGLSAALTLHDAGVPCTIYEASDRVGGRIHSATHWSQQQTAEWCGEYIDSDHSTILALARRFRLPLLETHHAHGEDTGIKYQLLGRSYTFGELTRSFQEIAPRVLEQYHQIDPATTWDHYTPMAAMLDHMSTYDWIERYIPDGHASPTGMLLDTLYTTLYGVDTWEQSAMNLVTYLGYLLAYSPQSALSSSIDVSYRIAGGNQRLPEAIAASLPEDAIRLRHRLAAIKRHANDRVTLTFDTERGFQDISCEYALLTLPFSALREVDYRKAGFDALKQKAIAELGYGTNSKLMLQFDARPWQRTFQNHSFQSDRLQAIWEATTGQQGEGGILVHFTGGTKGRSYAPAAPYTTTNEPEHADLLRHYARDTLEQLETLLPGLSDHFTGEVALSYPTGDPFIRGSYACWLVGQVTSFCGYEGVRQGPILFAGEHCANEMQGFMEGGAQEGVRAAREILQDCAVSVEQPL